MTAIYILLPHNTRTGGPEALLQLSDALCRQLPEIPTYVVSYTRSEIADLRSIAGRRSGEHGELVFGQRQIAIPEYASYRVQLAQRIPNRADAIVVLPEVLADIVPALTRNTVLLWWLSVDNAFPPLAQTNLNHLRHPRVHHACQSAYARRFVDACGLRHEAMLSDYTSAQFALPESPLRRERVVALNASAKVVSDLDAVEHALLAREAGIEVVRVSGMSREELAQLLQRAAVFVDLASFPGKDRMPREAARLGCPVVIADAGAGHSPDDFPIAPDARVSPWDVDAIVSHTIALLDPQAASAQLRAWQPVLDAERSRFEAEARNLFSALGACAQPIDASALTTGASPSGAEIRLRDRDQDPYQLWRSRRTPQEIDGQIHAERMMQKWRFHPRYVLAVRVESDDDLPALADTIDSLARQWYRQWSLVVFAPGRPAPAGLEDAAEVTWIADPQAGFGFQQALAAADADFVAILPCGAELDDHALQLVSDHVNLNAGWLAVYLDHDRANGDGTSTPTFKPDFNFELLCAHDYIGPAAFLCREAIQAFADGPEALSASPFGMLLRLYETASAAAIGHVSDPLLHLPSVAADHDVEQRRAIVDLFGRRGVGCRVADGWFSGTRQLRFDGGHVPSVSAIVLTHSEPGFLKCALESLLTHGAVPDLEVLVVAHRVTDPDLVTLLDRLAAGDLGLRCRIFEESGEFLPAQFRNRAAAKATGEYLLFMDDDVEWFQADSLARLVRHATAAGVAAVAPRLVTADEGSNRIVGSAAILGVDDLCRDIAPQGASLFDASRDLRMVLDQEASALPASCLVVQREAFERLGGFDADEMPLALHVLDLCLRLRAAGARLVWLASVDAIHHQGKTLASTLTDAALQAGFAASVGEEQRRIRGRHLAALAHDPAYNRHLSLREPFHLDLQIVADWDPAFRDRPRLLGAPLTTGAGQYRVIAPFRALAKAGLAQCTVVHPIDGGTIRAITAVEVARLAPDSVLYQNAVEERLIHHLAESRKYNPGVLHIATIDDRLGDLPRDNPIYPFHARHGRVRLRQGLSHCHRLIVTTDALREYCAEMIDDIRVVPNRLERDIWTRLEPVRREGPRPRVGWVGAQQHGGDLKLLEPVVRALADEVDWVFMGMCPATVEDCVKETHEFVSIRDYPAKMASLGLDLALAPLEIHPFNECKSNLRLLEYGALGWPVICTDIEPYRRGEPPVLRLPNHPDRWISAIRERLSEPRHLKAEGDLLKAWVRGNYILEDALEEWQCALCP